MKKANYILMALFAFALAAVSAPAEPAQNAAKKRPVHPWTIPSLDDKFNKDEANFNRYARANSLVKTRPVAVFMGDSITDGWVLKRPEFFAQNNYVGRGIGGQVSSQILVRFRRDVVDLKPQVVLILAGTNDIARNRGYIAEENTVGNIISMCEISKANGIIPVICSVLPAVRFGWRPEINPVEPIKSLNAALKKYAEANNILYLDYYSALVDKRGGLPPADASDCVHPTPQCYAKMEAMAKACIDKALSR